MPRLSDVMHGTGATWGEQYDKSALRGIPFWIHNAARNSYLDKDGGETVSIIVLDITLHGSSRRDPHAVIVVGDTPDREPLVSYFIANGNDEPIGPVHIFEVPLRGGRSFWRIEDYDPDILEAVSASFDADGQPALPEAKRRK